MARQRTRSDLSKQLKRGKPEGILEAVEKKGAITMPTLVRLMELLKEKTSYPHHIEVAVCTGPLLKVLDNETDALETIRRLEAKPQDEQKPNTG